MESMWITVENTLKFGDIGLGISKLKIKGFAKLRSFPHLSPQVFTRLKIGFSFSNREVICNYKKVVSFTHLLTAVITTNYKYKFSLGNSMRVCEAL